MTTPSVESLARRVVPQDPTLRLLAIGNLVNRAGSGAMMTTLALYFTHVEGLRPTQVGIALSIGSFAGLLTQVPAGHLGDLRGPREVLGVLQLATGLCTFALLVTTNTAALVLAMALILGTEAGCNAVRSGYVARIAPGREGVHFKAYLRAVTNFAIGFGAVLGGIALWIDRPWAYLAVFALDGASSVVTGLITTRLPHLEPAPARKAGEPRLAVLRDVPFVAVTLLTGVVSMHFVVIEVGIPLWIAQHTSAPKQMVALLLILNTAVIAIFQVRVSRGTDNVTLSATTMLRGAAWIAAAFGIFSLSAGVDRWAAIGLMLAGSCVHVVGEMLTSAAQWGTSMGLAPQERQGQYQGFAGLGFGLAEAVAPTLIAWLCIDWGRPGWLVLGAMLLAAGALMRPVCAWALRTREQYGAATATG